MATPTLQQSNTGADSIIAGYFSSGEDAHRAIEALFDQGFEPSQIGAAFHSHATAPVGGSVSEGGTEAASVISARSEVATTVGKGPGQAGTSAGGPASDTGAVQPIGLSTGAGTPFGGAGRPGPITGTSNIAAGLPSELAHELPHDAPHSAAAPALPATGATITPVHTEQHSDTSWTAKLKHLFTSRQEHPESATTTTDSQNFGTGEGHLGVTPTSVRPYSQPDFEQSVSGVGIHADHSRHLSHRLAGGGAVVTVRSTGRVTEVEAILERHHGIVRFANEVFGDAVAPNSAAHVEVFGHLEHTYPGFNR